MSTCWWSNNSASPKAVASHQPLTPDDERIQRELEQVIALMQQQWPAAVDYSVLDDNQVEILDNRDRPLAVITSSALTDFWNAIYD